LEDYRDYLRARNQRIWEKDSPEAVYVRRLGRRVPQTFEDYRVFVETRPPEIVANIALCLVHQTNYLLDQQIRRLERDFVKEGGLRERMSRARRAFRDGRETGTNGSHGMDGSGSRDPISRIGPISPISPIGPNGPIP